jgi:hypothetical protein
VMLAIDVLPIVDQPVKLPPLCSNEPLANVWALEGTVITVIPIPREKIASRLNAEALI